MLPKTKPDLLVNINYNHHVLQLATLKGGLNAPADRGCISPVPRFAASIKQQLQQRQNKRSFGNKRLFKLTTKLKR